MEIFPTEKYYIDCAVRVCKGLRRRPKSLPKFSSLPPSLRADGLLPKDVMVCHYPPMVVCIVTKQTTKGGQSVARGNFQNLVQNQETTPEQRREWARKAGLASAAARHKQKLQRDILKDLLSVQCDDEEACEVLRNMGLDESFANAANLAVLRKAVRGDVESLRYIRDTIGEKPTETMQLGVMNTPVKALDMTKLSDAELEALADRADAGE